MLSGDLNVVDVEWIVQYEIKEPQKFLFNIRNPRKTLRDISESVMREVVGDFTFDEVLTTKRVEIDTLVQEKLQKILDSYQVGIKIVTVKLQDVNPPVPVQPAFNEVNEAKQEREKMINQAWAVYNKQIPEAKGKALKIIREAEGYATEVVNKAEGDAKRFLLLLDAYKRSKDITRRRIYLENMVKEIESIDEFHRLLEDRRVFIVDFWAPWCGPCFMIKPFFEELSRKKRIETYSINIDVVREVVNELEITAIPTFVLFVNGEGKYGVIGADPSGLKKLFDIAVECISHGEC